MKRMDNMDINWYPGHMAKAKRLLADQLSRVDVVVELCDARLPYSSRNPDLDKLLAGKKRVLLLNKADLADPAATSAWLNYFRAQGIDAAPYSASTGKAKDALAVIDRAAKEAVERAAQKGIRKTVKAMVVGVPNVGKSTFTNKLHGGNIAKTGDRPGVTRANQWVRITPYLDLLDTPGLLWPRLDDQLAARRLCYIGTVKDDVVDLAMRTIHLLQDLLKVQPQAVMTRFRFDNPDRVILPGMFVRGELTLGTMSAILVPQGAATSAAVAPVRAASAVPRRRDADAAAVRRLGAH